MLPAVDDLALLAAILGLGFLVEAVAGFGGTVVALSLGARWFPIDTLLAWFLPLNIALSAYLALRHRHAIERRLLGRRILPAMLVGLAIGSALAQVLSAERGAAVFAAVVVAIALFELAQLARRGAPMELPPNAQLATLGIAGVVHGLFATGGPLAVAVSQRAVTGKSRLRATLAVLWLVLNILVVARLAGSGVLGAHTLPTSLALAPALGVGLVAGELIHRRVPEQPFRWLVAGTLAVVGLLLLARSL